MKKVITTFLLALAVAALAKDPRVVYKKATEAENEKAEALLREHFDPTKGFSVAAELFDKHLICPAGLWEQIKSDPAVMGLKAGILKGRVPRVQKDEVVDMVPRDGKLFQSLKEVEAFWKAFGNTIKVTGTPTLRKLNELEIDVLWTMVPFPIEEPCFIMEWKEHQILIYLNDNKVFWIDELKCYIDGSFWKRN